MEIEFERKLYPFALMSVVDDVNYIFCVPKDQKLEVVTQINLIHLTGAEIVRVHAVRKYTMIEELRRMDIVDNKVDPAVVNRTNAFRVAKKPPPNKAIPVSFTPNIITKTEHEETSTVFCNKKGELYPFPENMASDAIATLAKMLEVQYVLARFRVEYQLLEKASPHRSQADIK